MKRTKTFTVEYNYFEPGRYITATYPGGPVVMGYVFEVEKTLEPDAPDGTSLVYLKNRIMPVYADGFREVTRNEWVRLDKPKGHFVGELLPKPLRCECDLCQCFGEGACIEHDETCDYCLNGEEWCPLMEAI